MAAPTSTELGLMIGQPVDVDRAEYILSHLGDLARTYVDPMTDAAWSVVMLAAVRLYVNAPGASYQTIGPESAQFTISGVNFTKNEQAELRRIGGKGGAFTIDPSPADAGDFLRGPVLEDFQRSYLSLYADGWESW